MHTAQGQVLGLERETVKNPMRDEWKGSIHRQNC